MQPDRQTICQKVLDVCQNEHIHCLYAIESGSRAWGFASPDSDFDVRVIYAEQPDYYWQIFPAKDTFEFIQNDVYAVPFDIGGWELRKALQLLYKSNSVILEWINSPIVYHANNTFITELKSLQYDFFNARACFYHYHNMAKNVDLDCTQPIKLKKYFYVLRALLASIWVKIKNQPIPVEMMDMAELLNADELLAIQQLIEIKKQVDEQYTHQLNPILQQLIIRLWQQAEQLPFADIKQGDIRLLNDFFKRTIDRL